MCEEVELPNELLGASPQKEEDERERKKYVTMTVLGRSAVTAREQKLAEEDAAHRAFCCDFRDTLGVCPLLGGEASAPRNDWRVLVPFLYYKRMKKLKELV